MNIKINSIIPRSYVDGPGPRTVLFVQGCPIACPGCQSKKLWPESGGYHTNVTDLAVTLATLAKSNGGNITLSGGEILMQAQAIAELVNLLRSLGVKHIIAYTGFTWEQAFSIYHPDRAWLKEILENIDVLVDGPFIRELDNDFLMYRGSSNQRPIDVPSSLEAGYPISLDWTCPEIVIRDDGSLIMPEGLAAEMAEMGESQHTRMCGEISHA